MLSKTLLVVLEPHTVHTIFRFVHTVLYIFVYMPRIGDCPGMNVWADFILNMGLHTTRMVYSDISSPETILSAHRSEFVFSRHVKKTVNETIRPEEWFVSLRVKIYGVTGAACPVQLVRV